MKLKAYVITKADIGRMKVPDVIGRYGWHPVFVCHTDAQRRRLIRHGIDRIKVHVSGQPITGPGGVPGVSRQRNWVVKNLMPADGSWSIWLDDNVYEITGLERWLTEDRIDGASHDSAYWKKAFAKTMSAKDLTLELETMIDTAQRNRVRFCGFSVENNWYFRQNKWQDFGYCRTAFALYRNDGSGWVPFPTMMLEDLYQSIRNVAVYGRVLVNRHIKGEKKAFESGGIGSFEKRLPFLRDNCRRLMEMFPGLVKYANNGTTYGLADADKFQLTFAKRSINTVNEWRREHGYI